MSEDAVIVAAFEPAMLPAIFRLFSRHFPAGDPLLDPAFVGWLYADNPLGPARIVRIEDGGGDWLAFMALIPVRLRRHDQRLEGHFVVNVLVDPAQRGRNLFGRMIVATQSRAASEGTVLIGHPNAAALKAWQRAGMDFQEGLRPVAVLGIPGGCRFGTRAITTDAALEEAVAAIDADAGIWGTWKVSLDPAWAEWRFLRRPGQRYDLRALSFRHDRTCLQVSRPLARGASLLIDQFAAPDLAVRALRRLPLPSVAFLPTSVAARLRGAVVPLPLRKQMPMFATNARLPLAAAETASLNLSASDF